MGSREGCHRPAIGGRSIAPFEGGRLNRAIEEQTVLLGGSMLTPSPRQGLAFGESMTSRDSRRMDQRPSVGVNVQA
jgi:hypothetical protein